MFYCVDTQRYNENYCVDKEGKSNHFVLRMACKNNHHHVYEKPLQHLGLDDWHSRSNQLKNIADVQRYDAFELRQTARNLRNETAVQTTWDTYQNNARLADRYGWNIY